MSKLSMCNLIREEVAKAELKQRQTASPALTPTEFYQEQSGETSFVVTVQ